MPVYIPEQYREVQGHVLLQFKLEMRVMEVAESGQRILTLEASGAGGCVFTTAALPQGATLGGAIEQAFNDVMWQSVLTDIPF